MATRKKNADPVAETKGIGGESHQSASAPEAHGYFELTDPVGEFSQARVLNEVGVKTEIFARISTVAGGSVFTVGVERGKQVANPIDTGMVLVNHPTWTAPDLPFGGIKSSGYGREMSAFGNQEFVIKKLIRVSSINAPP